MFWCVQNDVKLHCAFDDVIVTNVHSDKFGVLRKVSLRNSSGKIYERDIRKLCLLEGDLEDSNTLSDDLCQYNA